MTVLVCSKCEQNMMQCRCENFHPNIPRMVLDPSYQSDQILSVEEMRAIARVLENQFISYEDTDAHQAVNKLFRIVKQNDLVGRDRSTT